MVPSNHDDGDNHDDRDHLDDHDDIIYPVVALGQWPWLFYNGNDVN